MLLLVVDSLTKMAHLIPIGRNDAPTVAQTNLENLWEYELFPEAMVSDGD